MTYTDQMMREVRLLHPPSRIVSLVPSLTELLYDLGLENEIAGITKFCIHPESIFKTKTRVGGTKKINHDKINEINPDLIIANKEENLKSDIALLENKFTVWISDIKNLEDALDMILKIGVLTGKENNAKIIIDKINTNFTGLKSFGGIKTLYLIWKNPYMAAGSDTFIHDMLNRCGMHNVLDTQNRYPELSESEIKELDPNLVLLSSEPYPFKENHIAEIKKMVPQAICMTVDGECFSWYGSHLIQSPAYFNSLIDFSKSI